jgi:hypothetical protein
MPGSERMLHVLQELRRFILGSNGGIFKFSETERGCAYLILSGHFSDDEYLCCPPRRLPLRGNVGRGDQQRSVLEPRPDIRTKHSSAATVPAGGSRERPRRFIGGVGPWPSSKPASPASAPPPKTPKKPPALQKDIPIKCQRSSELWCRSGQRPIACTTFHWTSEVRHLSIW